MKKLFLLLGITFLTLSCNDDDDFYTKNLVAYYPFNGNAINEVSSNNNGIIEGAILTSDIHSSKNRAYYFDGIDDVIKINHSNEFEFNLLNEFTISALVKTEKIKTQHIITKGASVNGEHASPYGISISGSNDIIFTVRTENGQTINQARKHGYEVNEWYLITGVFKNNSMYLYVNGVLGAFEKINGTINENSEPLLIGSRLNLPSDTFNGAIDEIRIYNFALNESEVKELYKNL